ncbi:hypothetical protein FNV43_RR25072 [Rhamnella rubrinervis]|uniref:LRAT domain-containing protein n=1 Tax=Rhamnella rubrinervis TaxID=2594499 RepID=A0A8K0DTU7_9ROSA|nr:hypothetical protein FNV43_RR25072 [Rhamnella rubrinervis]
MYVQPVEPARPASWAGEGQPVERRGPSSSDCEAELVGRESSALWSDEAQPVRLVALGGRGPGLFALGPAVFGRSLARWKLGQACWAGEAEPFVRSAVPLPLDRFPPPQLQLQRRRNRSSAMNRRACVPRTLRDSLSAAEAAVPTPYPMSYGRRDAPNEGDGMVIHLTRGQIRNGLIISSAPSHAAEGPVELCCLEEFLSGGGLYRFEYGVNALFFLLERPGTCTRASCEPPQDVLFRASFLLKIEFGDYDLTNNNCEDFAFYCKTGLLDVKGPRKTGTSGQIASFVAIVTTIFAYLIMPYGFLPTSFIGLALMFFFFYCNTRLHFDAGSRINYLLQKVPVEEFTQLSCPDTTEWMEHGTKWIPIVVILALIVWYWTPKSMLLSINLQYTRLFLIVSCLFQIVARLNSDGLMPSLYILNSISAFMLWYWTPEDTNLQWIKLFLLNVCFVRLVADLRNHRLLPSVYVFNFVAALILWYWTPDRTIVVWIRPLLVFGLLALFIINPNFRLDLGPHIDNLIWLFGLWYWTPESTSLLWFRFIFLLYILLSYLFLMLLLLLYLG